MSPWWEGPSVLGLTALICAVGLGVGLWSTVSALGSVVTGGRRGHDSQVSRRIAHALRDISAEARAELSPTVSDPIAIAGVLFSPAWTSLAHWFDQVLGGANAQLPARAGVSYRVGEYRLRRLLALLMGAAAGCVLGGVLAAAGSLSLLAAVVLVVSGAVAGLTLYDRQLRTLAKKREERLVEEFPTVLELLTLALSAGDSLPGALRRIAQRGSGELATEWARVMRMVDVGQPLGPTLVESARSLGVPEIEALTDHLASALERGAPLAEVVRAHSSDSRLERLRSIVDKAGKAEVAMLVPLVLLILPITVVFAVWPSLQALEFGL